MGSLDCVIRFSPIIGISLLEAILKVACHGLSRTFPGIAACFRDPGYMQHIAIVQYKYNISGPHMEPAPVNFDRLFSLYHNAKVV